MEKQADEAFDDPSDSDRRKGKEPCDEDWVGTRPRRPLKRIRFKVDEKVHREENTRKVQEIKEASESEEFDVSIERL